MVRVKPRHLRSRNVMRSTRSAVQNKGITLNVTVRSPEQHSLQRSRLRNTPLFSRWSYHDSVRNLKQRKQNTAEKGEEGSEISCCSRKRQLTVFWMKTARKNNVIDRNSSDQRKRVSKQIKRLLFNCCGEMFVSCDECSNSPHFTRNALRLTRMHCSTNNPKYDS